LRIQPGLQADRHIPGIPVVGVSAFKCKAGMIQSNPIESKVTPETAPRMIQKAADTSSACGTSRQKPGHVVMRDFRDWLGAAARAMPKARGISVSEGCWHEDQ